MIKDAEARRLIGELTKRIEELEARPKIWRGTAAEHAEALEKGEVRVGDLVIIPDDPDDGTAGGEGADTDTDAGEGADTDTGTDTGTGQETGKDVENDG